MAEMREHIASNNHEMKESSQVWKQIPQMPNPGTSKERTHRGIHAFLSQALK